MLWLLDTNVISELVRPRPAASVEAWVRAQSPLHLCLSVLTLGEIEKGIAKLDAGTRRDQLLNWAHSELPRQFIGRLLQIDADVANTWGTISAAADITGRPLPVIDGLLLATARCNRLTFVTRNVVDCAARGIPIYDPWNDAMHGAS